MFVYIIMSFEI